MSKADGEKLMELVFSAFESVEDTLTYFNETMSKDRRVEALHDLLDKCRIQLDLSNIREEHGGGPDFIANVNKRIGKAWWYFTKAIGISSSLKKDKAYKYAKQVHDDLEEIGDLLKQVLPMADALNKS